MRRLITVVFVGLQLYAGAQTGIPVSEYSQCDQLVKTFMNNYNVPGAIMAITKNGKLIYNRGFGTYDLAETDSMRPYHLLRIASVSKPITGIAIMKLMEDGKLTLDQQVFGNGGILDQVLYDSVITDNRIYDITIRDLLLHKGGWDRNQACPPYSNNGCDPIGFPLTVSSTMGAANPVGDSILIQFLLKLGLDHDPGTTYAYSNIGYLALGKVIEKLTGMSYEDYVRQHVILPAGACDVRLTKTLYEEKQEREGEYHTPYTGLSAWGTGQTVSGAYGAFNIDAMHAHGGWMGTPEDLVRLILAVDRFPTYPDILASATIDTMVSRPPGSTYYYAYGWETNQFGNWWHTGGLPGTASIWVRNNNGYTWVFITNFRSTSSNFYPDLDNLPWSCLQNSSGTPTHDLFPPKVNTSGLTSAGITNGQANIDWTNGSGTGRIVVAKDTGSAWAYPLPGKSYIANPTFGQGDDLGNGNYVMYDGSGSTTQLSGLSTGSAYDIRVYEYTTDNQGRKLYRYCEPAAWRTSNVVGIAASGKPNFRVYPNPFRANQVHIEIPDSWTQPLTITLIDLLGNQIARQVSGAIPGSQVASIHFDTPIANGMYILQIESGENTQAVMLQKQ